MTSSKTVQWFAFRFIITDLFEVVRGFEKFMIMDILVEVLEEVVKVTASATRNGDEALGTKRRHEDLLE